MHRRLSRFLIILLLLSFRSALAQNSVEVSMLSGLNVFSPGHILINGKSYGAEVGYNLSMAQNPADWVRRLRVDALGITAAYRNMSQILIQDSLESKGFLGNVYTVSAKLNISIIKSLRTKLFFTTDAGFSYSTSSYFVDGNPIVASRLNFSPNVGLKFKTILSGSTSLVASTNIFHYSNIALKVPNNGVNSFEVSLGLMKNLKAFSVKPDKKRITNDQIRSFFEFGADIGRRGSYKSHEGNWKSGFYLGYNHKLNPTVSLKMGADAVYYYSVYDGSQASDQYFATSFDPWRYGMSTGADIWFGNLAVMTNYGYYFKFNGKYNMKTYWNAGFKYYFTPFLGIQGRGYVHKVQADFVGLGLMYRFGKKNLRPVPELPDFN